jgi:hypothetical protein
VYEYQWTPSSAVSSGMNIYRLKVGDVGLQKKIGVFTIDI